MKPINEVGREKKNQNKIDINAERLVQIVDGKSSWCCNIENVSYAFKAI